MAVDPDRTIGDEDLLSFIQQERERNPSIGESLVLAVSELEGMLLAERELGNH